MRAVARDLALHPPAVDQVVDLVGELLGLRLGQPHRVRADGNRGVLLLLRVIGAVDHRVRGGQPRLAEDRDRRPWHPSCRGSSLKVHAQARSRGPDPPDTVAAVAGKNGGLLDEPVLGQLAEVEAGLIGGYAESAGRDRRRAAGGGLSSERIRLRVGWAIARSTAGRDNGWFGHERQPTRFRTNYCARGGGGGGGSVSDDRRWRAPGVPDPGDRLHRRVRRHPDLDGTTGRAGLEDREKCFTSNRVCSSERGEAASAAATSVAAAGRRRAGTRPA